MLTRREALRLGLLAGATTASVGCARIAARVAGSGWPESVALPSANLDPTWRLVNRVGFGPIPGELARVAKMGRDAYIEEQLRADQTEDLRLQYMIRRCDPLQMTDYDLRDLPDDNVLRQLQQVAILRAVYSKNQLQERMVDFWTNHFNLYARKGYTVDRIGPDQQSVIRKNAMGNFGELLKASAHSPAMLVYLDNQVNRAGVPNENYAREIMELHTLGVKGGYTMKDIQEVARCLTGWSIENRFLHKRGEFLFREDLHDKGEKTVLGHTIPAGGGIEDGDRVLAILANHPSTAQHICDKLCREFVGDGHQELVRRAAQKFIETQGDIRSVLRVILLSESLIEAQPLIKRPFDFIVSALRSLSAETDGDVGVQRHLDSMSQPLYQWPMPDGYPDKTASWTGTLLGRWNFAFALANQKIQGTNIDYSALRAHVGQRGAGAVAELVLGRPLESPEGKRIERLVSETAARQGARSGDKTALAATLCFASPEFQWR